MKRGFFGIGIYNPKTEMNIGTLWRSAQNFGASFIFTIGDRYKKQRTDTTKTERHIPHYNYKDWKQFMENKPLNAPIVFIEQTEKARDIKNFIHPETAIYILGSEDKGIPNELIRGNQVVFIDTPRCLNVAVAGSIIMFDRLNKSRL